MVKLLVAGYPRIYRGSGEVLMRTKKHLALLVRLAMQPGRSFTRDYLVELLWADAGALKGRHSLAQAVTEIRNLLGKGAIALRLGVYRLEPGSVVVDRTGEYEFCDGFEIPECLGFQHWVEGQRALATVGSGGPKDA